MNKVINFWTKEECHEKALLCNSKIEFKKRYASYYRKTLKEKWGDEFFAHMQNPSIKWTYEFCKIESLKYKTKADLRRKNPVCYERIYTNKWTELFSHMHPPKRKYIPKWTYETIINQAKKYTYYSEFIKQEQSAYHSAIKNNWLDDIKNMLNIDVVYNVLYTYDYVKTVSKKYNNIVDFMNYDRGSYDAIKRNNWNELLIGMKTRKIWEYEDAKKEVLKYETMKDLCNNQGLYSAISKYDWWDLCEHLPRSDRAVINVVYIWNTIENPQLWKIGVSNHYRVKGRIDTVSKAGNLTPHFKKWKVFEDQNVLQIEKELLKLGEPYQFTTKFDGHSEFRLLTADEEHRIKTMIA